MRYTKNMHSSADNPLIGLLQQLHSGAVGTAL
jgi:hypothetical protein